jgi:hypothetical protein
MGFLCFVESMYQKLMNMKTNEYTPRSLLLGLWFSTKTALFRTLKMWFRGTKLWQEKLMHQLG